MSVLHALVTVKPGVTVKVASADTAENNDPRITATFTMLFTPVSFAV
jgi:hypothetical protein